MRRRIRGWGHAGRIIISLVVLASFWMLDTVVVANHTATHPHRSSNRALPRPALRGEVQAVYALFSRLVPHRPDLLRRIRFSIHDTGVDTEQEAGLAAASFTISVTDPSLSSVLYNNNNNATTTPQASHHHQQHHILDTDDPAASSSNNNHGNTLHISGTTASEVSAGLGWYLRHSCRMTLGWPRGGGSSSNNNNNNNGKVLPIALNEDWPRPSDDDDDDDTAFVEDASSSSSSSNHSHPHTLTRHRAVPWSYLMNVCTHSYSLVWYDWQDWESFIDWMSVSGINLLPALTGQEEVQYKVFTQLGLSDRDIRTWFNGPAFLTWSRGQNEYGSNIGGPLPRSWMQDQWRLQRSHILPRLRSLGITGQLPAFQGNVPLALQSIFGDANITREGETGWMDSLDPLYATIADLWMETLIRDFGTDHWYQLDGYFNGGTAPWMESRSATVADGIHKSQTKERVRQRHTPRHNDDWFHRGAAAYQGLNRTDPHAVWSFQGFSFESWSTDMQALSLRGFIDSVPMGKFVILDMTRQDHPEWQKWDNSSLFGTPFVWTTLHNFGGTDGMKGDLSLVNRMPFEALAAGSSVVGSGATPEGINQNPAYYEFVFENLFREKPVADIYAMIIQRSHRRYGLDTSNAKVARAWRLLVDSSYSDNFSVQDHTGIAHLKTSDDSTMFESDRYTPQPILCKIFEAWQLLIDVGTELYANQPTSGLRDEPFVYDLVNVGREVLAQISIPLSLNFTMATKAETLVREDITRTGNLYIGLLLDTDTLVATNKAFLLGPWIESARKWGALSANDCPSSILTGTNCSNFYEWNARAQITTWNPTAADSPSIPGGPIDYAAKHWSGLIRDYYGKRANLLMEQALTDESSGLPLNQTMISRKFARHAFEWTTARNSYPTKAIGDAIRVSRATHLKYRSMFKTCGCADSTTDPVFAIV